MLTWRPGPPGTLRLGPGTAVDVARAAFVGTSFGGAIAWQITARYPERVRRLVLIAPVGYTAAGQLPWALRLLAHPFIGPLLRA